MNELIPATCARRFFNSTIAFLLVVITTLYFSIAHAASGRVINEVTGKPIEGVFVIATWVGRVSLGPEARSGCYKIEMTRTDKEGKFSLPDWSFNLNPFIWRRDRYVGYYFTNFEESPNNNPKGLREPPDKGDVLLRPYSGDIEERLNLLATGLDEGCMSPFHVGQALFPFYEMNYEEAKRIAQTPDHQRRVASARHLYEKMGLRAGFLKTNKDGSVTK